MTQARALTHGSVHRYGVLAVSAGSPPMEHSQSGRSVSLDAMVTVSDIFVVSLPLWCNVGLSKSLWLR